MKLFFLFLVSCLLFLVSFQGCSSLSQARRHPVTPGLQVKEIILKPPQAEPRVGEKLTYTIRWIGIPVATLTMEVKEKTFFEGAEVYHLMAVMKSNGFLSRFYKIDDVYQSYWDAQNHFSRRFERKVAQGKYRAYEINTFYPSEKKGVYFAPLKDETKEFTVSGPAQDILSSIYYFRTVPYQTDLELLFPLVTDEKNWQVGMKTVEQGVLEIRNLGTHEAFLIEPSAILTGPPDAGQKEKKKSRPPKGKLWIWFSADEKRIPLTVRGEATRVGEITITLESIELAN
jgi:hypothetical protein